MTARPLHRTVAALLVAASLAVPARGLAQAPPAPAPSAATPGETAAERRPFDASSVKIPSASDVGKARRAFERGRALYLERRYGQAIEVFLSAHRLAPVPGLLYNAALAAHKLNHLTGARDLLRRYLERPPRAAIHAEEVARARALLEEIEQQLPGTLQIETDPPGAKVFVDSQAVGAVGTTPFRGPVRRGPHAVIIDRDGHATERHDVVLRPGEITRLVLKLRASVGRVSVLASVDGARVLIDGKFAGVTPLGELKVGAGQVKVEVVQPGFLAWSRTLEIAAGLSTQVEARLQSLRPFFWAAVGVGAAGLIAGVTFAALTSQTARDLEQASGEFGGANSALQARGETYSRAAIGLLVVGGAGLLSAAGLLIYERKALTTLGQSREGRAGREAERPGLRVEAAPWLAPGQIGAGARIRF